MNSCVANLEEKEADLSYCWQELAELMEVITEVLAKLEPMNGRVSLMEKGKFLQWMAEINSATKVHRRLFAKKASEVMSNGMVSVI